jgi:hypothetical protein
MMKAAKLPASLLTPLEKALKTVRSDATFTTLSTVTRNVAQNPREEKFRRLRLTNAKISAAITTVEGAMATLTLLGWVQVRRVRRVFWQDLPPNEIRI